MLSFISCLTIISFDNEFSRWFGSSETMVVYGWSWQVFLMVGYKWIAYHIYLLYPLYRLWTYLRVGRALVYSSRLSTTCTYPAYIVCTILAGMYILHVLYIIEFLHLRPQGAFFVFFFLFQRSYASDFDIVRKDFQCSNLARVRVLTE